LPLYRRAGFYVYVIFDLAGVPRYVGKGKGKRWLDHEKKGADHANPALRSLIKKAQLQGMELPKFKLREGLTEAVAYDIEALFIRTIGRRDLKTGPLYNLNDGGMGGVNASASTRAKQGAAKRGRKLTAEHRAKIGAGSAASWASHGDERRAKVGPKISAAHTGMKRPRGWWSTPEGREKQRLNNHGNRHPRSPEMRARISASVKATMTPEHRARLSQIAIDSMTDERREVLRQMSHQGAEARWGKRKAAAKELS
jgi:hypothetical protein